MNKGLTKLFQVQPFADLDTLLASGTIEEEERDAILENKTEAKGRLRQIREAKVKELRGKIGACKGGEDDPLLKFVESYGQVPVSFCNMMRTVVEMDNLQQRLDPKHANVTFCRLEDEPYQGLELIEKAGVQ